MAELEDKEQLSDSQLCEELARLGSQSGPVTDTTRLVYQRHLRRLYSGKHPAAKEPLSGEAACNVSGASDSGKDVFISYGRGTVVGLEELKSHLESAGYTVWLDCLDMSGGSDWHTVIGEALRNCRCLVALISTKYTTSKHCKNELFMANSLGKALIPVVLETVEDPGVQFAIASLNWIVATDGFRPKTIAQQLIQGLQTLGISPRHIIFP